MDTLRVWQGIGMSVVAGLAAVGYDAKHKAMLNSALLIYHLSVLVGLTSAACLPGALFITMAGLSDSSHRIRRPR